MALGPRAAPGRRAGEGGERLKRRGSVEHRSVPADRHDDVGVGVVAHRQDKDWIEGTGDVEPEGFRGHAVQVFQEVLGVQGKAGRGADGGVVEVFPSLGEVGVSAGDDKRGFGRGERDALNLGENGGQAAQGRAERLATQLEALLSLDGDDTGDIGGSSRR